MKVTLKFFLLFLLILPFLSSCSNDETYAEKLKKEKTKLNDYIQTNNLEISSDSAYCFSHTIPWPENLYFKTPRGAYINIISNDTTKRAATEGCSVIVRYVATNIEGTVIADNTSTADSRNGYEFIYTADSSTPCIAWNDVMPYLHNDAEAKIIATSKIGFSTYQSSVTTVISTISLTITN